MLLAKLADESLSGTFQIKKKKKVFSSVLSLGLDWRGRRFWHRIKKNKVFSSSIRRLRTCHIIFPVSDTTQIPLPPGDLQGRGCKEKLPAFTLHTSPKATQRFSLPCPSLCSSLCHYGSHPRPGICLKHQSEKEAVSMGTSSWGHFGLIPGASIESPKANPTFMSQRGSRPNAANKTPLEEQPNSFFKAFPTWSPPVFSRHGSPSRDIPTSRHFFVVSPIAC